MNQEQQRHSEDISPEERLAIEAIEAIHESSRAHHQKRWEKLANAHNSRRSTRSKFRGTGKIDDQDVMRAEAALDNRRFDREHRQP